jgi:SAM-dependent methyltransferase
MNSDLDWQRRYEEKDTPWDKGAAAPPLVEFLRQNQITGRVLVPGCGRGHEVRALGAQPHTTTIGLDLSPTAILQARALVDPSLTRGEISFVEGDFFALPAALQESFDWLVEHTCFCAIEPHQRENYVLAASSALRPGGKIFAIFYLNPDSDSGPPFPVSRAELSRLFDPHFLLLEEWVPRESFPGRENRELVRIMQKR